MLTQIKVLESIDNHAISFIKLHMDGRITKEALDYYRSLPTGGVLLILLLSKDDCIVSLSACKIENNAVQYGITVTHKALRNKGFGSLSLWHKLNIIDKKGIKYQTIIADDNLPSLGIVKKNRLTNVNNIERNRRDGVYTAKVFETI